MKLFHKHTPKAYNPAEKTPIIKCSICTGEQVAGFQDNATKAFEDIMLIQDASDLAHFREMYDIIGDIKKIYQPDIIPGFIGKDLVICHT